MPLFEQGFRPFFLLASLFSIIAMLIWMANYTFAWQLPISDVSPIMWHAHEMVFGYSVAIIGGFLLTMVQVWTGVKTVHGLPLFLLASMWLLARCLALFPHLTEWAALFDILFLSGLTLAITIPVVKVKQWQHTAIVAKVILILIADIIYYFGIFDISDQGVSWGIFSGVYLIMALLFSTSRRVLPFFIERSVGYQVKLKNWLFIDIASLLLLAGLWIADVFFNDALLIALLSLMLALIHTIRLWGWYTKGIWAKPLIWGLYLGYSLFVLGFILKALNFLTLYPTSIPLHAFTYGGLGMMSLAMIARISLAHTGRDINQPPRTLSWIFAFLFVGTIVRVIMPIFLPGAYLYLIGLSQLLWIVAFTLFLASYMNIFITPDINRKPIGET